MDMDIRMIKRCECGSLLVKKERLEDVKCSTCGKGWPDDIKQPERQTNFKF